MCLRGTKGHHSSPPTTHIIRELVCPRLSCSALLPPGLVPLWMNSLCTLGFAGLLGLMSIYLSLALAVTFRPDGAELAVATLNSQITFWDPENAVQVGSIEGRHDLKTGRKELDKITAKHAAKGK